jgi:hypothetical protein
LSLSSMVSLFEAVANNQLLAAIFTLFSIILSTYLISQYEYKRPKAKCCVGRLRSQPVAINRVSRI